MEGWEVRPTCLVDICIRLMVGSLRLQMLDERQPHSVDLDGTSLSVYAGQSRLPHQRGTRAAHQAPLQLRQPRSGRPAQGSSRRSHPHPTPRHPSHPHSLPAGASLVLGEGVSDILGSNGFFAGKEFRFRNEVKI